MATGYLYRTAITRLCCSERDRKLLSRTIDEWLKGCQIATEVTREGCYDKRKLQSLVYDKMRQQTNLKSQHVLLAIHQSVDVVTSCHERRRKGAPDSKPQFTSPTVVYDIRTMTVQDDYTVTLATVESRVRVELVLSGDDEGYQQQFLENDLWEISESTLHYRNGSFYLHIGFRRPEISLPETTEDGTVLGVDLGIDNLAVTTTARFFSGRHLAHRRSEFARTRCRLDQNGSRSATRTLRSLDNGEERYVNDVIHRVAKGVVEEARTHNCDVIALEDLKGIRERLPPGGVHFLWAFRRLQTFIEYKSLEAGIRTRKVSSEYTSQRCAGCGHTAESNRPTRDAFHCEACGNQANADYNAAKNIAEKCIRFDQQSSDRMGVSRYALKSGVMNPKQGFVPAEK